MSFCKYCGEKIRFLKTVKGNYIPVDWEAVTYRKGGAEKIVTPLGEVFSCVTEVPSEEAEGTGYVPHWATCAGGMEK